MQMIADQILEVKRKIGEAARRAGREEKLITLLAVSKGQPIAKIQEAWQAGQMDFGENYAQELLEHACQIKGTWHFIGHLQRNKVKSILPIVTLVHSVDSPDLAKEIDKRAGVLGKIQDVLIELNLADETSKSGLDADKTEVLVREMNAFTALNVRGLMAIPPDFADPEAVRPYFRRLREIRDAINRQNLYKHPLTELSMGMTHDFEIAVEEGSTIVRVGTGIFGERQKK